MSKIPLAGMFHEYLFFRKNPYVNNMSEKHIYSQRSKQGRGIIQL